MNENIAIAWTELTVSVYQPLMKTDKVILDSISGYFEFNKINALMGSSGSGKTTLLKCFNASNKYSFGSDSNIWVKNNMKIKKCFVYQNHDKRVITGLTVRQALSYASKLKNSEERDVDHNRVVSEVMSDLLVTDIGDQLIEKCSGGQIKRICIGLELTAVRKPDLLLIDEPTTGLDSNSADVLIDCLRGLSRQHRMSVIVSIHQPNSDLFNCFDSVYVLAKGGVCLYSGPPKLLRQHLDDCMISYDQDQIDIELLIKISSNGINDRRFFVLSDEAMEKFKNEEFSTENMVKAQDNLASFEQRKHTKLIDIWHLLTRSLHRNYVNQWKGLAKTLLMFSLLICTTVLCFSGKVSEISGCFELNVESNLTCVEKQEEKTVLFENQYLIYFSFMVSIYTLIVLQTNINVNDIQLFVVEHKNGWYSSTSFWLSKFLVDNTLVAIFSAVFLIIYQGIRPQVPHFDYKLGLFFNTILMTFLITKILASIVASIIKENNLATVLTLLITDGFIIYNNFFFRISLLPEFFGIIAEFDYFMYYFNSLIILFYGLGRCPDGEMSRVIIEFDQVNDEYLIWKYFHYFQIYFVALTLLEFTLFTIKAKNYRIRLPRLNLFEQDELENLRNESSRRESIFSLKIREILPEVEVTSRDVMIAWSELSMDYKKKFFTFGDKQLVLNKISGHFETNTLNAIMGPSGAGKTSLMNCLQANGVRYIGNSSKIFSRYKVLKTVFIKQNISEHLLSGLTVRQTLLYASQLKNSRLIHALDHNLLVKNLMSELLLRGTADTRVEYCSGGEQKRIVIASELTAQNKPDILFIDEPTSGLDSNAAEVTIRCLRRLSRKHDVTIIVSVHQPNQELFQMFDKIYVLAKGGVCVYTGPPHGLRQHLKDCNIECNENTVPIEKVLKICSEDQNNNTLTKLRGKMNEQGEVFYLDQKILNETMHLINQKAILSKRFSFKDFYQLMVRTMTYTYKCQWKVFFTLSLASQFMALVIKFHYDPDMIKADGCLEIGFGMTCNQTLEEVHDEYLIKQNLKYNAMLLLCISFTMLIVMSVTFCNEFKIFINEHDNGWYSTGAFLFTKTIVDFLPQIPTVAIFCLIIDFYRSFETTGLYFTTILLVILCIQSLTQLSGSLVPDEPKTALLMSLMFFMVSMITSNTFFRISELHYSVQMLSAVSYIRLSFESLLIVIYGFDRCPDDQISAVLMSFGVRTEDFWPNIINLIIVCILFKVLTLFALILKTGSFFQRIDNSKQNHQEQFNNEQGNNDFKLVIF